MSNCFNNLNDDDRKAYLKKLTLENNERLPDPYEIETWVEDINKFPIITWRDVTEYLIDSPSIYTKETMKAYKSLEAYDYFVCGHVQDCFFHDIGNGNQFCFIKAKVSILRK